MYENFYSLREKPFSLLPDPAYLYLSEKHQMALTLLEYGVLNQAGFCVISGQAGVGKTTLIRHLLGRFGDDISVGLLSNTHESFGELLTWILMSFGLDYAGKTKTELYQTFVDFVIDQYANNRYTLLIVDEAQNMSPETLEELRMLSNVNADKDQVLQIILVGQPRLLENLRRPDLEQFSQRIAVDYNLEPLSQEETHGYIQHRLKVAGGKPDLFEQDACDLVYHHSGGIPRLINMLCDTALVYGYAEQADPIDARIVGDVVREREKHGVLPKFKEPELTDEPVAAKKAVRINKKKDKGASKTKGKQKKTEEVPMVASASSAAAGRGEANIQLVSGGASISDDGTVSVTHQNQAEHVARAIELNKKFVTADNDKAISESIDDEVLSKTKNDEESRAGIKEVKSSEDVANDEIQDSSESIGEGEDNVVDDIDSDVDQREPIDLVNEERLLPNSDIIPLHMQSMKSNSKIGFGVIGFTFGLFLSAVILFFTVYKSGPATQEITKGETSTATSAARSLENELKLKAEVLRRERDAALAEARVLQRERDAAIAVAEAQEQVRQAEIKANRARQNELRATAKANRARERAHAAAIEAEAARLSEQKAAQEAAKVQEEKERAAQMRDMETVEPVQFEPVQHSINNNELADQNPSTVTRDSAAGDSEVVKSSRKENRPGRFSPDPCKGPSAVFLSTCKR